MPLLPPGIFRVFMVFSVVSFTATTYDYVVVNFLSQVIFVFLLLLGMVLYANKVETKEI